MEKETKLPGVRFVKIEHEKIIEIVEATEIYKRKGNAKVASTRTTRIYTATVHSDANCERSTARLRKYRSISLYADA
jgi:hypothetical protein